MPYDKHKFKRGVTLDQLQPAFREKVEKWLNDCQAENILFFIDFTLRSYKEQEKIYNQGRFGNPGPVVTNAKPGYSYHNFGFALDVYPLKREAPHFDASPKEYERAAKLAKTHGISWGGNWVSFKDYPHFEDEDRPTLADCRKKWPNGFIPK